MCEAMQDTLITPDEQYELRCLPVPEVRLDSEGVWQLERHAWFAARCERDRWVAFAYTPTPSPRQALAALMREIETIDPAIGFAGAPWSEIAASPTAVAALQRLCLHVMTRDLASVLRWLPPQEAEAIRDAVQDDIEAGAGTAFSLLDPGT